MAVIWVSEFTVKVLALTLPKTTLLVNTVLRHYHIAYFTEPRSGEGETVNSDVVCTSLVMISARLSRRRR
jgi:hypothetical protein